VNRRTPVRSLAAASCLLGLLAAACSTSNDSSSSSGGGTPGAGTIPAAQLTGGSWNATGPTIATDSLACSQNRPTDDNRGITQTSVKIGGFGTVSGPTIALWGDSDKGANARYDAQNAAGGVNGRMIDYTGMSDDGLDSTRSVTEAQKLAEQDKVLAVAPLMTQLSAYQDTLCKDVVPYVGWGFNTGMCGNTVGFGFDGCLVNPDTGQFSTANASPLSSLLSGDDKSVALVGNDDEAGKKGNAVLADADKSVGLDVVYNQNNLPDNAPLADPSPVVNGIMTSNNGQPPAAVYLVADFANTQSVVSGLRAAGYEGVIVDAVGYDPRLASFQPFDNSYVTLLWAPFESTDVPFVKQMTADLDKYASDAPKTLATAAGYISADFMIAALKAAGPDLTVTKLLNTMNSDQFVYSQKDFIGETHWPLNHLTGAPCGTLVQLKDQVYKQVEPLSCTDVTVNHP
jgi:ABC-type branched-subunit amino acid transport system substrate-binding protein